MVNTRIAGISVARHPRPQFGQGSPRQVTNENKVTGMIEDNQTFI